MFAIAFTGQDGTGKSTQLERLGDRLAAEAGLSVAVVHQYGPTTVLGRRITPVAKRVANRLKRNVSTGDPRAGGRARRPGLLRFALSVVSLGMGWFRSNVNWLRHRGYDVLILDRYFPDEAIRVAHKFGQAARLARWLSRAVPPPDVLFTFTLDPRVGWERKKTREMTLEEYEEKTDLVRRTLADCAAAWPVVTIAVDGKGPDEVAEEVWSEVRKRRAVAG
jgi:thymidylate kinase